MPTKDPRVDAYIAKAQPFAKPILAAIRKQVHESCPEVVETIKWSFPNFVYRDKVVANMAGFKAHCSFGLWRREGMINAAAKPGEGMGHFGKLTSLESLPSPKKLDRLLADAMKAIDAGGKLMHKRKPRPMPERPDVFIQALKRKAAAKKAFDALTPGHQRQYVEWILEAKRPATQMARVEKTIAQVSSGKSLNWKYER